MPLENMISSAELLFDFMQDMFKLILKWMEIFPKYLDCYRASIKSPELYLVYTEAAISMCGYELLDIFDKCFGGCINCSNFIKKY